MSMANTPPNVPFLTTEQMREVDRAMVEDYGIALVQMMEHAGRHLTPWAAAASSMESREANGFSWWPALGGTAAADWSPPGGSTIGAPTCGSG